MFEQRMKDLAEGKVIKYRESGNSMKGIISHRELITAEPIKDYNDLKVGDAVFCKVKGNYYTHLIKAIRKNGESTEFLIGNNHGGINGWTKSHNVFARIIAVGG
jgi:sortase (surface protein transpeptidase)